MPCLSVALLSACLHGFHPPKQADFGPRDHVSWLLWVYRLANVINLRETDFFLPALICKNPESRPCALPWSNQAITGWWEGQHNWPCQGQGRVRSIRRKKNRRGIALKV